MKIATSFLAALLFTGALGSINTAMSADGVISKDELATDSYCHEKFHAMTRQSLDTDNPVINNSGAVIDFYGPCNENPVGEDQIQDQKLEAQHRFTTRLRGLIAGKRRKVKRRATALLYAICFHRQVKSSKRTFVILFVKVLPATYSVK